MGLVSHFRVTHEKVGSFQGAYERNGASQPSCNFVGTHRQASKIPYGPFEAKPARASAFISVSILLDTEALAGFAMLARASAFNRV